MLRIISALQIVYVCAPPPRRRVPRDSTGLEQKRFIAAAPQPPPCRKTIKCCQCRCNYGSCAGFRVGVLGRHNKFRRMGRSLVLSVTHGCKRISCHPRPPAPTRLHTCDFGLQISRPPPWTSASALCSASIPATALMSCRSRRSFLIGYLQCSSPVARSPVICLSRREQ